MESFNKVILWLAITTASFLPTGLSTAQEEEPEAVNEDILATGPGKEVQAEPEEELKDNTVIKVVKGLRFRVPEDMPVTKRGGVVAPVDLYEYMALKFSKVDKRLADIESQIQEIKKEMEDFSDEGAGFVSKEGEE